MDGFAFLIAIVSFVMALVALNKISKLETAHLQAARGTELRKAFAATADAAPAAPKPCRRSGSSAAGGRSCRTRSGGSRSGRAPQPADRPHAAAAPARDMEQALAGRWFVWIGGVAIAIGGLLFVKYAYDNGLISPVAADHPRPPRGLRADRGGRIGPAPLAGRRWSSTRLCAGRARRPRASPCSSHRSIAAYALYGS